MIPQSISNLQLEILKLYSTNLNEEELQELKKLLAENYAKKAVNEADSIWEKKQLSDKDMDRWSADI
jgi:hypothetical protein